MNTNIHIMHILPSMEMGGMENGVVNLINETSYPGFSFSICCLERKGPMIQRLKKNNVKVHCMDIGSGLNYKLSFKLAGLFRREAVMIVHTHNFDSGLYGILASKLGRVPVVIHGEHGSFLQEKSRRRIIGKWLYRMADYVITMSKDLRVMMTKELDINPDKIGYIHNGIDLNKFTKLNSSVNDRNGFGFTDREFLVGTVGRLVPVKDYKTLINGFALFHSQYQNSRLIFVGEGPEKVKLMKETQRRGIEKYVSFLGERDDIPHILGIFDVFCLTSLTEGISNTILEAMATGLPVIASEVGGTSEIIQNQVTGLLFKSGDTQSLALLLEKLMADRKYSNDLGKNAREWVEKERSLGKMVQQYTDLYLAVLKRKGMIN